MVHGLPLLEQISVVCEGYMLGKQHIDSFPLESTWRATSPLELVHTDICGPMKTESIYGNRKFKAMTELQSGYKIKGLRSDRGGEFLSGEFNKFCDEFGIQRQLTVAYSPQQDGVARRKNRTVVEMAKSMLHEKGIPYEFWADAVNTAVYLLNRCPTKSLKKLDENGSWKWENTSAGEMTVPVPTENQDCNPSQDLDTQTQIDEGITLQNEPSQSLDTQTQIDEGTTLQDEGISESSQAIDHTPKKWRSVNEIMAQCNMYIVEPESFEEANLDESWKNAMKAELEMIEKNNTWTLGDRPFGKPIIGVKWVYKMKLNLDGSVQKNKARLVAKDYSQRPRIDYNETFALVARLDTIRTLIALAAQKEWILYQLDVKSAFLNGVLKEEVCVE
ncbi:unnamed protein product [Prunus armeniaca]